MTHTEYSYGIAYMASRANTSHSVRLHHVSSASPAFVPTGVVPTNPSAGRVVVITHTPKAD